MKKQNLVTLGTWVAVLVILAVLPRYWSSVLAAIFLLTDVCDAVGNWIQQWLTSVGISTAILFLGIIGWLFLHNIDKWSIETNQRIIRIEQKLGIEHQKAEESLKAPWLWVAVMFLIGLYVLGRSLRAESIFAFGGGITVAAVILLIVGFASYCFADEAIRNRLSKHKVPGGQEETGEEINDN